LPKHENENKIFNAFINLIYSILKNNGFQRLVVQKKSKKVLRRFQFFGNVAN